MRKICGSIERIDMPAERRIAFRAASFLGDNRMLRETAAQEGNNGLLGTAISLCNDVDFTLVADVPRSGELRHKNGAPLQGSFDSDFEEWILATHMPMFWAFPQ